MPEILERVRVLFAERSASVNQSLVLPKVLYFLHYGAISWFVPFLGIYLRTAGLGDGEIGVLYAVGDPPPTTPHRTGWRPFFRVTTF